jgi:hypothetical protein
MNGLRAFWDRRKRGSIPWKPANSGRKGLHGKTLGGFLWLRHPDNKLSGPPQNRCPEADGYHSKGPRAYARGYDRGTAATYCVSAAWALATQSGAVVL